MEIRITPTRATEGYYCEGTCNSKESVSGRPVMRIDSGDYRWYRCSDCSLALEAVGVDCHNCGDTVGQNSSTAYCGSCGDHDDCISTDEGHHYDDCDSSSCYNCGDEPRYCNASCAIAADSTVWCNECGEEVHNPGECSDCKANSDCVECKTSTGTPALVGAASTITNPENVDDDGNVVIDGLEIRF